MKDIRVELNDLDYSREKIKESKGLTALQKCRIFDAIDGAKVILKEQQNQLFELQDHNEYLQDKLKEQETVVKQWTKEIADSQLVHAPKDSHEFMTLDEHLENEYKRGIWDGLQIAWNIISEGR